MPVGPLHSWSRREILPALPSPQAVVGLIALAPSTAFREGTTPGETNVPGVYTHYDSGNTDGSQVPRCILQYECSTDAGGLIVHGPAATNDWYAQGERTTSAYFGGAFRTSELTGFDANAFTALGARLVSGDLVDGIIAF